MTARGPTSAVGPSGGSSSRGLPHFIDEYRATTDVWTRAAPFLTVVFLAELAFSLDEDREGLDELLPLLGGLAIFVAGDRGGEPPAGPSAPPAPRPGGHARADPLRPRPGPAARAVQQGPRHRLPRRRSSLNLVILAVTYAVTSYGLVPMTRWALGQMFRQLANVTDLMVRSLPLLLLFATFLFLNHRDLAGGRRAGGPVLADGPRACSSAPASLFLVLRQRREVDEVSRFRHLGRGPGCAADLAGRRCGHRRASPSRRTPSRSAAGPGSTSPSCWSSARGCRSSWWRP